MRRRTGGYVVAATLLALAVGCTPPSTTQPPASPSPAPPSVTPTPTPSPTENAEERRMRLDQEAAERAYQAVKTESERLAMAGGAERPTSQIVSNAAGYYVEVMMNGLKILKKNGWKTDRQASFRVYANRGWSPTEVGLTACEDTSGVKLVDKAGKEVAKDRPRRFVQSLTATKVGRAWRITDVDTKIVKSFEDEGVCAS